MINIGFTILHTENYLAMELLIFLGAIRTLESHKN